MGNICYQGPLIQQNCHSEEKERSRIANTKEFGNTKAVLQEIVKGTHGEQEDTKSSKAQKAIEIIYRYQELTGYIYNGTEIMSGHRYSKCKWTERSSQEKGTPHHSTPNHTKWQHNKTHG